MPAGACNCGAVAFEIDGPLSGVFVCHCSICRRFTGSNGIAVVVVGNQRFRWTRGQDQITAWSKPGSDWHCWFCKTCGAPLPGPNDDARMFIPAGLLTEGADALKVLHHIWVDSRAPWDEIADAGKQHREAFEP
jgi:hypothetical protein